MEAGKYKKADWVANTNIYEVNLRQYTTEGSFNAFAQHLPRLAAMGVDTLWFMPVTPIAQKNKKGELGSYYACSDFKAVNPEFGTLDEFKDLVKAAQALGFKVIMDWVANHTGWDHVWTKTNQEYYSIDTQTHDFKTASGMEDIIELNYDNAEMEKAMIDAMAFWIKECNIDGFRCDLAFWVKLDFWTAARTELEKTKTLFWLGEFDPIDSPAYCGVFDAAYTWTWMHKTEKFYQGEADIAILKKVLQQYEGLCINGNMPVWFTSNHDENSWNGTEYEKYGDLAPALAVFSILWTGIPMIYGGQEIPNKKRLKFFEKDTIEWKKEPALHSFYKTLLDLRRRNNALNRSDALAKAELLKTNVENQVLAFMQKKGEHEIVVLLNFSDKRLDCSIIDKKSTGNFIEVFSKTSVAFTGEFSIPMQPREFLVFEKNNAAI